MSSKRCTAGASRSLRAWRQASPATENRLMPAEVRAAMSGLLAARHFPGLVKAGDCVSVIAREAG